MLDFMVGYSLLCSEAGLLKHLSSISSCIVIDSAPNTANTVLTTRIRTLPQNSVYPSSYCTIVIHDVRILSKGLS